MEISNLEPNTKVINLIGKITRLEETKETPNGTKLQECVLEDHTGQVKLTLWGEQAGKYAEGDKIIMTTGWAKEFEGALQISAGKFGRINKVPEEKNGE